MEFTSLTFMWLFLPILMVVYLWVPPSWRLATLCLFSLAFYTTAGLIASVFLVVSILWGFFTALLIERRRTLSSLLISISVPFAILFVSKYLSFILQAAHVSAETQALFSPLLKFTALPPGVSFYTFHIVCYAIDVYDRKISADRSLLTVSTYICFFPQLIAGPITRYLEIAPQLRAISKPAGLHPNFAAGLKLFSIGLFGKILVADLIGTILADRNAQEHGGSLEAAFEIIAYSFQIYYDFWAYSLMAIGLALLVGITLPKNFDQPYLSRNPKEFWSRWHITLSFWLRDYVYLKLGGNTAYVRNIIIVFLLVGLWHGAGWNFIAWGAYQGALILVYHSMRKYWDRLPDILQIATTFSLISLGWPLFRYDISHAGDLFVRLFSMTSGTFSFSIAQWLYLGAVALVTFCLNEKKWIYDLRKHRLADSPVLHAVMAMTAIVFLPFAKTFIYFQF